MTDKKRWTFVIIIVFMSVVIGVLSLLFL